MTMPLATCPYCGNDEDGKILIAAFCTVTIEKDDSFLYEDADVTDESRATCLKCGHVSRFRVFKQGVAPPTPSNPSKSDWLNAAREIWNWDSESDVWIPEACEECCELFQESEMEPEVGIWITGARIWVSRQQLDAYLARQRGDTADLRVPHITYLIVPADAGE